MAKARSTGIQGRGSDAQLSERARYLLKALVESYIRGGKPVGSRYLARAAGVDLSPATVRNVMADLEEMGFVRAPHTSAGRVPTPQGYRFFVDTLLEPEPLGGAQLERLQTHFADPDKDTSGLLSSASALLSGVTHMAGVVTLPRRAQVPLRELQLLPLGEERVLAVLVMSEREVENKIIRADRRYSASELTQISNYLNARLAGKDLLTARMMLVHELQETRQHMDQIMRAALQMAEKVFDEERPEEDFIVAGQINLMEFEELSDVEKLRRLFEAFQRKREMLRLLDQCIKAEGVQIFIGAEAGYRVFDDCSLVTAPYGSDGEPVGVLGVIGPTRMAYDRVIPVVDVTAKLLGSLLTSE